MPVALHTGDTDLLLPAPGTDPTATAYTVYTHYFAFTVPEARIGAYVYLRCQPGLGLSQGGVSVYSGLDNLSLLDADHHDYRATMPWPVVDGTTITAENGLRIEVVVPGERLVVEYRSPDGATWFRVTFVAVTPLIARGHVADIDAAGSSAGTAGAAASS